MQKISDNLKKIWNWICEKFNSVVEWTKDKLNQLKNMIRGAMSNLNNNEKIQLKQKLQSEVASEMFKDEAFLKAVVEAIDSKMIINSVV